MNELNQLFSHDDVQQRWIDLSDLATQYEDNATRLRERITFLRPRIKKLYGERRLQLERRIRSLYNTATDCQIACTQLRKFIEDHIDE